MRTKIWFVVAIVLFIAANANAQVPPKFIVLKPAVPGKPAAIPGFPRSTRRTSAAPLSSGALLLAVKSSTKIGGSATGDYVNLSANQTFVANKGMLTLAGGSLFPGANGGMILLDSQNALGIVLFPDSTAKTYLVDVLVNVQAGESLKVYSPGGGFTQTTYAADGDQHLLFMVTPPNTDFQFMGVVPSKSVTFYSCKISVLK